MKKVLHILLIVIGLAVLAGTFYFLWQKSQPEIVTYRTETMTKGEIIKKTMATGKIEPRDEILIKPQISGIITELYHEAGDNVEVGEVIAKVQVIPEMGQLNQAQSSVRQAELNYKQSTRDYERLESLYREKVVAKEEFEKAATQWASDKEDLQRAKDQLEIVTEGISKRSGKFNNTQIRSTIKGMILDIPVKVGNSVILANTFNEGTTIASVADLNDMLFVGNVDETEVGKLKQGMPLKLLVGAMQGARFDALLEYIAPKAQEANGVVQFQIKAAAQIPDSIIMRAGYSANAEIILDSRKEVMNLPEYTISFENDSSFVYVLTSPEDLVEDQVFDRRYVELGLSDGVRIELLSGLEENEKVRGTKVINK